MTRDRIVRTALGLIAGLWGTVVATQFVRAGSPEDAWLERSRAILESAAEAKVPGWLRTEPGATAQAIAEGIAAKADPGGARSSGDTNSAGQVLIFASLSIPRETLSALLDEASEANVTLVLRGVPAGKSIPETIKRIRSFLPDPERLANVMIDPTLFRRYGIERVPTFALERGGNAAPVMVEGAVTVQWLRRVGTNARTDSARLVRRGESYAIEEPDLIEEMQARMAKIDWEAHRRRALEGFWDRQPGYVDLPNATVRREFRVDPSVKVTEDVLDANGEVLLPAGARINPLAMVPLSKAIIIFRGSDPKQVAAAAAAASEVQHAGHGVILLTTEIERSRGWDHLNELEGALSGPVYLLPTTLAERFHLEHVPSVVRADGKELVITELPVGATP